MTKPLHQPLAPIVWFDPGETTGVCVLALDPRWLAGEGDADWLGMRRAIKQAWFEEIGAEPRDEGGHKPTCTAHVPDQWNGPAVAKSAAVELDMIFHAREILDAWPAAAWGYEDYIPESMAAAQKSALTPMRFFSTLAFGSIMDDQRVRVPFVQSRTMKSSASNDRLRLAGLYKAGMGHATDAARHAAVFARAARQKESVRRLAWPRLFDPERSR